MSVNHEDENELFQRLESEMAEDKPGAAPDFRKGPPEPTPAPEKSAPDAPEESDPSSTVLVDSPGGPTGPGFFDRVRDAKRRPVLPLWVKSKPDFVASAGWLVGYAGHTVAYHGARTPWYTLRLTARAPSGAAKFVGGTLRWMADREGEPLRLGRRPPRGRGRVPEALPAAGSAGSAAHPGRRLVACSSAWPRRSPCTCWPRAGCRPSRCGAVALALGCAGRSRPMTRSSTAPWSCPRRSKLTSDIVLRALGALGISRDQPGAVPRAATGSPSPPRSPATAPAGCAEGDLPYGVTVTDVIDRRERLASGLRRPLGCVWPEAGTGRTHRPPACCGSGIRTCPRPGKPAWPLAKSGSVDLFKPVAFGTDQRGRWVEITLMYIAGRHRRHPPHGQDVPAAAAAAHRGPGPARRAAHATT